MPTLPTLDTCIRGAARPYCSLDVIVEPLGSRGANPPASQVSDTATITLGVIGTILAFVTIAMQYRLQQRRQPSEDQGYAGTEASSLHGRGVRRAFLIIPST